MLDPISARRRREAGPGYSGPLTGDHPAQVIPIQSSSAISWSTNAEARSAGFSPTIRRPRRAVETSMAVSCQTAATPLSLLTYEVPRATSRPGAGLP